ncbi:MAG: four helix bundle protein [Bacteroidetes bacterium]|nr:four helix bundle protein [Bacteroidota bacterium]MBP6427881.1 four helix bundle protein [Bacteroidia bacterium]MBK8364543.1 four helix bundle protein [Bacteroidota bacterium]MBK9413929.1 four helix bundle protein [Bacteroidota bacterium]MBL0034007.1 four helix bundle protein [Bacteroidota bacterium]
MDNNKKKEEILPRSRKFAIRVLKLGHYLKNKKVEYFLRDQVARSGASIGANLHEAKASSSDKEFCRFYEIALRSGYETEYWFEILDEIYKISEEPAFVNLRSELIQINKIISVIVLKLKDKIEKESKKKKTLNLV